jgi:hypothetical protein
MFQVSETPVSLWNQKFMELWQQHAKMAVVHSPSMDYEGVDFSEDNMWVEDGWCWLGATYRKDVSVDDSFGTYQSVAFRFDEQGYLESHPDNNQMYLDAVFLCGSSLREILSKKINLQLKFSPGEVVKSVFNEIGLYY